MKPKVKKSNSISKEDSKSLISLWWKLSVNERKEHFQAITVDLLAPYLFKQTIIKDPYFMSWESEFDLYKCGRDSDGNILNQAIIIMDLIEEVVGALKNHLSKFDSSRYLDKMIKSMETIGVCRSDIKKVPAVTITPSFTNVLEILRSQEWFNHFRLLIVESSEISSKYRDAALVVSSIHVYTYISSLHNGARPLDTLNDLASLNDVQILAEKEKGNTFFKKQSYEQAIVTYSRLLDKRPFSHVIYSNRAECYLKNRHYRLALMDAKRTIVLDPTSEKGHYRYCRALEQVGWDHTALKALKVALKISTSAVHLEEIQRRVQKRVTDRNGHQPVSILELSDEPPDLVSGESGDESSNGSQSELSDLTSSDECDEDFAEQISSSEVGVSDSDCWCDIDEQDESSKSLKVEGNIMNRKKAKQGSGKFHSKKVEYKKAATSKHDESIRDLKDEMEKGTKLFLTGKYDEACFFFNLVLNLIKSGKNYSLDREEEVVLIYAYGMCSFLSGSPSDLESAKAQFDRIIRDFSDINFPLVYYICAKIYQKQSRFFEMLSLLNYALDMVSKSGVSVRKWPGSESIIEETKPGELEKQIKMLLDSVGTSNADAICRYERCNLSKRHILLNELDSKGFFQMKCSEFCRIEYHSPCWQQFKQSLTLKDNTPLKGFLNQKCFTPDCSGVLIYICFTFLSQDSEIRHVEHKVDLPKKVKEVKKVDKSKGMKKSRRKTLKKKEVSKAEREKETLKNSKPKDDDLQSSILNELNSVEMCNSVGKRVKVVDVNQTIDEDALILGHEPRYQKEPSFDSKEIRSRDSGLFVLNDKSSYQDSWQAYKNQKKTNNSKLSSVKDVVSQNSDFEPLKVTIPRSSGLEPETETFPEPMRDKATEHIHSLFADILVSKGSMNVKNDKEVIDLLKILDNFSATIINSCGGLGKFLAMSNIFAFDPDDSDIVYLAEEADIYVLSKKEAESKKMAAMSGNIEFCDYEPMMSDKESQRNKTEAQRDVSDLIFQKDSVNSSVSQPPDKYIRIDNTYKKKGNRNGTDISSKTHTSLPFSVKKSKGAIAKQTALWNETENERGLPDKVFEAPHRFGSPVRESVSRLKFAGSLQRAVDHYKTRTQGDLSDIGSEETRQQVYGDCLHNFKCMVCGYGKEETKGIDAAIMTEFEEKHFEELYKNEAEEKKNLLMKQVEILDSLEQTKNKLKVEKETSASREMELRANLECVKNKLTKETQSMESMQKKWQQEKEKQNRLIQSLEDEIKRIDEDSYKAQLRDQQIELNRAVEKVGEMTLDKERVRAEYEDIISKLSSCVTEQTKRAQKAEVSLLNERKAEAFKHFQALIEHSQATIHIIEHSPFIERDVNRSELSHRWKLYNETLISSLKKDIMRFDDAIKSVESGVPLDKTEPIDAAKVHAPPPPPPLPQPKFQYPPSAPGPPYHAMPVDGNMPRFMQMFPQRIPIPNMMGAQYFMNNQKAWKDFNASAERQAQATANLDEKPNPSSNNNEAIHATGPSPPSGSPSWKSMHGVGEEKASEANLKNEAAANSKAASKGGVKSSSFEKIMMKLSIQFPSRSRDDLVKHLKDFRELRNNTLSGLTVDDIIEGVSKLLRDSQSHAEKSPATVPRVQGVRSRADSMQFGFEEPCVICHDDMVHVNKTTQLQCHHVFHTECIQRWLKQQRTCPTCRDHALLPEEFPALN